MLQRFGWVPERLEPVVPPASWLWPALEVQPTTGVMR